MINRVTSNNFVAFERGKRFIYYGTMDGGPCGGIINNPFLDAVTPEYDTAMMQVASDSFMNATMGPVNVFTVYNATLDDLDVPVETNAWIAHEMSGAAQGHECSSSGGCRIWTCRCVDAPQATCEACADEVVTLVRRPNEDGTWRGTYCSWECMATDEITLNHDSDEIVDNFDDWVDMINWNVYPPSVVLTILRAIQARQWGIGDPTSNPRVTMNEIPFKESNADAVAAFDRMVTTAGANREQLISIEVVPELVDPSRVVLFGTSISPMMPYNIYRSCIIRACFPVGSVTVRCSLGSTPGRTTAMSMIISPSGYHHAGTEVAGRALVRALIEHESINSHVSPIFFTHFTPEFIEPVVGAAAFIDDLRTAGQDIHDGLVTPRLCWLITMSRVARHVVSDRAMNDRAARLIAHLISTLVEGRSDHSNPMVCGLVSVFVVMIRACRKNRALLRTLIQPMLTNARRVGLFTRHDGGAMKELLKKIGHHIMTSGERKDLMVFDEMRTLFLGS